MKLLEGEIETMKRKRSVYFFYVLLFQFSPKLQLHFCYSPLMFAFRFLFSSESH